MLKEHATALLSAADRFGCTEPLLKEAGLSDYIAPALIGAGIGGGAGLLREYLRGKDEDEEKHYLRSALLGALLGGGVGAGGKMLYNAVFGGAGPEIPAASVSAEPPAVPEVEGVAPPKAELSNVVSPTSGPEPETATPVEPVASKTRGVAPTATFFVGEAPAVTGLLASALVAKNGGKKLLAGFRGLKKRRLALDRAFNREVDALARNRDVYFAEYHRRVGNLLAKRYPFGLASPYPVDLYGSYKPPRFLDKPTAEVLKGTREDIRRALARTLGGLLGGAGSAAYGKWMYDQTLGRE